MPSFDVRFIPQRTALSRFNDTKAASLGGFHSSLMPHGKDSVCFSSSQPIRVTNPTLPDGPPAPFDESVYRARRERLLSLLPPKSAYIINAAGKVKIHGDIEGVFRQNGEFLYLTGCKTPNAMGILRNDPSLPESERFKLLFPPEGWPSPGPEEEALYTKSLMSIIDSLAHHCKSVGLSPDPTNRYRDIVQPTLIERLNSKQIQWRFWEISDKLRRIKAPEEIQRLRTACDISVQAHLRAIQRLAELQHSGTAGENQIEAVIDSVVREHGAYAPYPPIVASGGHGATIHYNQNNGRLNKGDLLMVDAAAEYGDYAADVSRTYPVSGTFTESQRKLYNAVLHAQEVAINAVKPGVTLEEIHQLATSTLQHDLKALGILADDNMELFTDLYPQYTSHMLGVEVHDGRLTQASVREPLKPGMVLTVEPGLTVHPDLAKTLGLDGPFGMLVEDDVLVTPTGHEVLTAALPKKPEEIEALMKKAAR